MNTEIIANGWGSSSRNAHEIELPKPAQNYDYCLIDFQARHYLGGLSWKLRDKSGFEHDLPYFFSKIDVDRRLSISKFTVIVYGPECDSDYKYECFLKRWPKELQMPRANYFSITTVEISPAERFDEAPLIRIRRKGEQEWKTAENSRVTFDSVNTVHECQCYYSLIDGTLVLSPILEVTCMWNKFDIEKDCLIDYSELTRDQKLSISFKEPSLYNTNYTVTIRVLDANNNNDSNEVIVKSNLPSTLTEDLSFVPGRRYELKMHIEKLDISYSRIIQVPSIATADNILWAELFGSVDQVTFHRKSAVQDTKWENPDHYIQIGEEETDLTLCKNGFFLYTKSTRSIFTAVPPTTNSFGGKFTLSKLNANNVRIDLLKLFKNKSQIKSDPIVSPIDINNLSPLTPELLKLPEIIKTIVYNAYINIDSIAKESYNEELKKVRLVSKLWSQAIQPTIAGTITNTSVKLFGLDIARQ